MNATLEPMTPTSAIRGVLRYNEPMAGHTIWAVGGPADTMFLPADLADLAAFFHDRLLPTEVLWVGLGSNLLVRDGGFDGLVVNTAGQLAKLEHPEANLLRVEAGVPCAKVARYAARHDLGAAAFFAGIPGTMGGALAMNAGAFGGETWSLVSAVETVDRTGEIRVRAASDYRVEYRTVSGPGDEWFVAAHLRLPDGDGPTAQAEIRSLLKQRAATQPTGQRSCGSVFRNPPGDYAGRLIEASGLKGMRQGGAVVSTQHANFIINESGASAADIEALITTVRDTVAEQQGVMLEPEVRIVGVSSRDGERS